MEEQKPVTDIIIQANGAVTMLRAENDRLERQIKELKDIEARRILGGDSTAGLAPPVVKVETAKEYADRVMRNQVQRK